MPSTNGQPPPQPARGGFRWLRKPDPKSGQGGVLLINDVPYLLTAVYSDQCRRKDRTVIGWKLKADATVYDVQPGSPHWQCDCGDFVFTRDRAATPEARECKHCRALKAALPLAAQPAPAPIEPGEELPDPPGTDGDPFAHERP